MTKNISSATPKGKAESITTTKRSITLAEYERMIAEAAYYLAEKRGFIAADMLEDWHTAEAEINSMLKEERITVNDGTIESQVRSALNGDPATIARQVRSIVIRALSSSGMDKAAIGRVVTAVVAGTKDTTADTPERAEALEEALRGLDEALAEVAEAMLLALQEAAGRSEEFSSRTLRKFVEDLAALESQFIETLAEGARNATDFAQAILGEFAAHAYISGTKVGNRVRPALSQLTNTFADSLNEQIATELEVLHKQSALLAGFAAGILVCIEERLNASSESVMQTGHR